MIAASGSEVLEYPSLHRREDIETSAMYLPEFVWVQCASRYLDFQERESTCELLEELFIVNALRLLIFLPWGY